MTKKRNRIVRNCGSTQNETPIFSFTYVDENRFSLHKFDKIKMDAMMRLFKKLEKMSWAQIVSESKNFKVIDLPTLKKKQWPSHSIDIDHSVSELRGSDGVRIFGFRSGRVYYLVWFDGNHDVFPSGK